MRSKGTQKHRRGAFASLLIAVGLTSGCGVHPEQLLLGCWTETQWDYERADDVEGSMQRWTDGVRNRAFPEREVVRHEAEFWRFHAGGDLAIARDELRPLHARWRLKGRGHVLTIRHSEDAFEVYEIKELNEDTLVLNFDMGVEVRGIARLEFARIQCDAAHPIASTQRVRP